MSDNTDTPDKAGKPEAPRHQRGGDKTARIPIKVVPAEPGAVLREGAGGR